MASDDTTLSRGEIEARIQKVGRYSRLVHAGLIVIVAASVLAVIGVLFTNLDTPAEAAQAIQMPLTFVGLGLLLYGIGMHLHLMHLDLVQQLQSESGDGD